MRYQMGFWAIGLCSIAILAGGCSGAGTGNTAQAAESTPAPDPIDELNATLQELGVQPAASAPQEVVYEFDPAYANGNLEAEVALLREHVHELERSLTFYMDTVVTDLQSENTYLREELARIYASVPLEERMRPLVPRPGSEVINELHDIAESPVYQTQLNDRTIKSGADLQLTIAKEWGRTPEEAATMGSNVTSLRGVIGSVQQGATDDALLEFARTLREDYEEYTNINVVIFDDELAAKTYAERNRKSTPHHVLSIARHAQSGLDEIYLHRNGLVVHTEQF